MATNTCEKISCKYCSLTAIVKYDTAPSVSGKRRQRYRCCVCNRTFVDGDSRVVDAVVYGLFNWLIACVPTSEYPPISTTLGDRRYVQDSSKRIYR